MIISPILATITVTPLVLTNPDVALLGSVLRGQCVWLERCGTVCADHTALERKGGCDRF